MVGYPLRLWFAGIGLVFLFSAGCMQIPYCIPEVNYAPSVNAQCKNSEVHAFRVDITQKIVLDVLAQKPHGEVVDHEELSQIRSTSRGN